MSEWTNEKSNKARAMDDLSFVGIMSECGEDYRRSYPFLNKGRVLSRARPFASALSWLNQSTSFYISCFSLSFSPFVLSVTAMESTPTTTAVPSRAVSEYHEKDIEKDDSHLKSSQTPSIETTPEETQETQVFSSYTAPIENEKQLETSYNSRPASVRSTHSFKKADAVIADEKDVQDVKDEQPLDESTFPRGLKLGVIIIGLCLSVFLVALVSSSPRLCQ